MKSFKQFVVESKFLYQQYYSKGLDHGSLLSDFVWDAVHDDDSSPETHAHASGPHVHTVEYDQMPMAQVLGHEQQLEVGNGKSVPKLKAYKQGKYVEAPISIKKGDKLVVDGTGFLHGFDNQHGHFRVDPTEYRKPPSWFQTKDK